MCDACEKLMCAKCSLDDHGMSMCHNGCCEFGSYELYCEDCIYPPSRGGKLTFCWGCKDLVCDACLDLQTYSFCSVCDDTFCHYCRGERLTAVEGASDSDDDGDEPKWVCASCAKDC